MGLFKDQVINRNQVEAWKSTAIKEFVAKMDDKDHPFPCIPATQGHSLDQFRYGFIEDPFANASTVELASLLTEYTTVSKQLGTYTSLIIFYKTPNYIKNSFNIEKYELLFWHQLSKLREMDEFQWPSHIPTDPNDPLWEFCFNKEQYFMYCATPAHKNRKSRHFSTFMLAITPRWVLENFNTSQTYADKIKSKIRKRLADYDSIAVHPDLNSYGLEDNYEWKQYYLHDDNTSLSKCPFHTMHQNKDNE